MEKIILVDVPSEIYNELRIIFINLFEKSGFKEIKINETVDFEKLYKLKRSIKIFLVLLKILMKLKTLSEILITFLL